MAASGKKTKKGFLPTVRFQENSNNAGPTTQRQFRRNGILTVYELQLSIQQNKIYMQKIKQQIIQM